MPENTLALNRVVYVHITASITIENTQFIHFKLVAQFILVILSNCLTVEENTRFSPTAYPVLVQL
jgi:hypothetical protein